MKRALLTLVATFLLLPLVAQTTQPTTAPQDSPQERSSTAAFDPEWLMRYYGYEYVRTDTTRTTAFTPASPDSSDQSDPVSLDPASPDSPDQSVPVSPESGITDESRYVLALRANLLRWVTLTPDLGLEWRISPSVGVLVNGSWTSWTWKDNDRRYALWEVAPEVRWYLGETRRWYVGAMYKAGQFNYKLGSTGRQGDIIGGGITGGYQLRLNKSLSMDFSLGLGYLNADYEDYVVTDAVRVRDGSGSKDWWGPINAGVTLVWKIF